jgi:hypothetical protein
VVEREKVSTKTLSEVRNDIQEILFKEKLKKRLEDWTSNLKKNAYISIR